MAADPSRGNRKGFASLEKAAVLAAIGLAVILPVRGQRAPAVVGSDDFRSLLNEGFALHQRADYAGALPLLEGARRFRPHDYFVNLLTGIDLIRTGKPEEAIGYLLEASHQQPKEDFPFDYMGEAQAQLGHFAAAAQAYSRAVEVAPSSSQAVEGGIDFAVERFRALSAELRSTTRGLAAEHRLQGMSYPLDDPRRELLLLDAAQMDPEASGIWSDLAIAHLGAGKKQEAKESLEQALKRNPNDLRARCLQLQEATGRLRLPL